MTDLLGTIRRIKIIDDDPNVREGYTYPITAADREPIKEDGPLGQLDSYLRRPLNADAAVSDYRLSPNGYAEFDGARLVAAWYKNGFPAILCTTFDKSNTTQFRTLRRWLPVVMSPAQLTPETLLAGLEYAQKEIHEEFSGPRRPWRALVHFVEYDAETFTVFAKLPAWSPEAVSLRLIDLPANLQAEVKQRPDVRCHAQANIGAESNDELYLSDWEV
jgi:hypothetical protein